jgi:hypothetical protein
LVTPTTEASSSNCCKTKASDDELKANEDGDSPSHEAVDDEEADPSKVYGKVYPMPENVKVVTGEEDEECIMQARAKLYKLVVYKGGGGASSSPGKDNDVNGNEQIGDKNDDKISTTAVPALAADWTEVGVGPIKLLRSSTLLSSSTGAQSAMEAGQNHTVETASTISAKSEDTKGDRTDTESPPKLGAVDEPASSSSAAAAAPASRLVMRRETKVGGLGTKLLLNVALKSYVTVQKAGEKALRLSCVVLKEDLGVGGGGAESQRQKPEFEPATFLIKTKLATEADKLYAQIQSIMNNSNRTATTA